MASEMTSDMFSVLDPSTEYRSRRGVAFICGLFAQVLLIGAAILCGVLFPDQLPAPAKQYVLVWLPSLKAPAPPVVKHPPQIAHVAPLPKPRITPEIPKPRMAELVLPKIQPVTPPPMPVHVLEMPKPPAPQPLPAVEYRPAPKVQVAVNTGQFGGASQTPTTKLPASKVQTGGFGSPEGLPGKAQGGSGGNVPLLGSFGLPDGPGFGNGTGGAHGARGVVASSGFGNGVAGSGSGRGGDGSKISMGNFQTVAEVTQIPTKNLRAPEPVDFQAVEIFSKPTPVYTEEARHLGIQGEVALSVIFEANGAIKVLGVVKSLGHGLDQAAQQAAAQIRFKPALRNGKPTDFPATLRIEFRLADQST